ncbi:MAG: DUF2381 family protein [Myxococcaceae bacterium]|nr:DUF2381 family protein [Myxococcaceae bacterium]
MSLPSTALLVSTCLLWAAATAAQPRPPPREKKERQATLPRDASESKPQVRVAVGVLTSLLFDAPLATAQVKDRKRFTRLDVGQSAIYLEPALAPAATERLELHVVFADGREAVLLLVSHPTEVDTRVDFAHPERSATACERELAATRSRCEAQARCEDSGPGALALSGDLEDEIQRTNITWRTNAATLTPSTGDMYKLPHWWVLTVPVTNTGPAPWTPASARLAPSIALSPWVVLPSGTVVAPGEKVKFAVELKLPINGAPLAPDAKHVLTLCDTAEERCLSATLVVSP